MEIILAFHSINGNYGNLSFITGIPRRVFFRFIFSKNGAKSGVYIIALGTPMVREVLYMAFSNERGGNLKKTLINKLVAELLAIQAECLRNAGILDFMEWSMLMMTSLPHSKQDGLFRQKLRGIAFRKTIYFLNIF